MKEKRLDTTSIVMIAVFVLLILGAVIGLVFASSRGRTETEIQENNAIDISDIVSEEDLGNGATLTAEDIKQIIPNAVPGATYTYIDNGEVKTVTMPLDADSAQQMNTVAETVENSKYKFETYTDLTDKFMELCKNGDIKELYNLYYGDFLEGMRLNMEPVPTKEAFEAGLKSNMLSITGFDEYEYGSMEIPPTQTPGSYANFIYSQVNGGKTLPLSDVDIEDCVNLVVYINNMYQTNHFMAKINGYWFFIV